MIDVEINKKMKQQTTLPKWMIYTVIGVVITLIISAILNILTPEEQVASTPLINTNYDQTRSQFSNLTYTGPAIEVPNNFSVTQVRITDYKQEIKPKLIDQLGLKEIKDYDIWTNEDWGLTIDEDTNRLSVSSQAFTPSLSKKITYSEATVVAQEFLQRYLPQYQVTPIPGQAEYFEGQFGDPAKTTTHQAKIIKIAFGYTIDNYPIFYKNNIDNFVEIYVDSNKNIRKASFSTNDVSLEKTDTKPSLSPQLALELANQTNKAAIINTGYESPVVLDFSNIISGEFNSVLIEYRVDPEQNLAYPFYHFSGTLVDDQNQPFSGEIITPAIETTLAE